MISQILFKLACMFVTTAVFANNFNDASEINLTHTTLRGGLRGLIFNVLTFGGIAALVVVVIAGIMYVVNAGNESITERAKKAIIYTIIGILLLLLAGVLASFVIDIFSRG